MAAQLLGKQGQFALVDETGMIIDSIDFDYSDEEVPILDTQGNQLGGAYTAEKCEVSMEALIASTADTPFAGKLGGNLALSNAMPADHFNESTAAGRTLIRSVKRSLKKKEWQSLSISATYHPLFAADVV